MKYTFYLILFVSIFHFSALSQSNGGSIGTEWEVGYSQQKEEQPGEFYPAEIPGAVQLDYMKAKEKAPWYFNDNFRDYKFLEDKYWHYRTQFSRPDIPLDHHLYFVSRGIDYEFEIHINGEKIHYQEGMFTPVELVLDQYLQQENTLEVIIYPIPKAEGAPVSRRQAKNSVKPAVPYGWDWHPRLVPVGIWNNTYLEVAPATRIKKEKLDYQLSGDFDEVSLKYSFRVSDPEDIGYNWVLKDKNGKTIYQKQGSIGEKGEEEIESTLQDIHLWWPHDQGEPYLYTSVLEARSPEGTILDSVVRKVGFRKVELVMNEGAWAEPAIFPKTRSVPPFTLKINGRRIFGKGSNWVHPEVFYGKLDYQRYLEQLKLAKKANFNILRVWGGGIVNKESFFNICDSLGILVWQDFPLSCNPYPDDPHYLEILEQEATSIIHRVSKHPSLAFWCGGNELFNNWSGMTDQSLPIRSLNSLCYQLDPKTPFIPTAPIMGVGHGHYLFYDDQTGEEVFQLMERANKTAYTEFGMPGIAPVSTLKKIIPHDELFPPKRNTAWETHHAFGAWRNSSWLEIETLQRYFGEAGSLKEMVDNSQLLQAVGFKCIYEEARRQKPYCSMALNWCFNEPWPTAVNNSLVGYPNKIKPAFNAVSDACRPVLASGSFSKFTWSPGEELAIDCWILNDSPEKVDGGKVTVFAETGGERKKLHTWSFPGLEANSNYHGPVVHHTMPENMKKQVFRIILEVSGKRDMDSEYRLLYTP